MKKIQRIYTLFLSFLINSCSFQEINFTPLKGYTNISTLEKKLDFPKAIELDKDGNLYVVTQKGKLIQKISYETGNISKVLDYSKSTDLITDINIKDDYLYFPVRNKIRRVKLNGSNSVEDFIGSDEIGDSDSTFKDSKFSKISEIEFDNNNLMYIYDISLNKFKKANLNNGTIEAIKMNYDSLKDNIINNPNDFHYLKINPKTNELNFIFDIEIAEISSNYLIYIPHNKSDFLTVVLPPDIISGYCYDKAGDIYVTSEDEIDWTKLKEPLDLSAIRGPSLQKYSNGKLVKNIAFLRDIKKLDSNTIKSHYYTSYIAIDEKNKLLYVSSNNDNKLVKINLKE